MSEYRFHLQKYRPGSKTTCPSCGKSRCFVRYIDEQGSISFPGNVGKCDHENSCGYHYTPKEYFKDNPDVLEMDEGSGKSLLSAPYKTADKTPLYSPFVYSFILCVKEFVTLFNQPLISVFLSCIW